MDGSDMGDVGVGVLSVDHSGASEVGSSIEEERRGLCPGSCAKGGRVSCTCICEGGSHRLYGEECGISTSMDASLQSVSSSMYPMSALGTSNRFAEGLRSACGNGLNLGGSGANFANDGLQSGGCFSFCLWFCTSL